MIISKKRYKKLLSNNKKLNKEVVQLENQIKYLRETKSPIIDQRDAEINALKHMLERLEASQEENKLQTRTLNKGNNELIEQLSDYQRKLSFLRCMFETKLELAEVYHNENEALMWKAFLKEVE